MCAFTCVGFTSTYFCCGKKGEGGGKLLQYLKIKGIRAEIVMKKKMVELLPPE